MRVLYTTLFLFLTFSLYSQNCKYELNEIDAITELKILRTKPVSICRVNSNPFLIKAQCIGDKKFLKVRYYRYNGFTIKSGSDIVFQLSNRSYINIAPRVIPVDTTQNSSFMTVSSMIIFDLNNEQFEQLLNFPIVLVKVDTEDGYLIKYISKNKQDKIQQIMRCIE